MPPGAKTLEIPVEFTTSEGLFEFTKEKTLFVIGPAYIFSNVLNDFVTAYIIYNSQGIRCADYHIVDSNRVEYSPPGVDHQITTLKYYIKENMHGPSLISFPLNLSECSVRVLLNFIISQNQGVNTSELKLELNKTNKNYILRLGKKVVMAFEYSDTARMFRFAPPELPIEL